MTINLDHTIVPARDKAASAEFFAKIFGLKHEGPRRPLRALLAISTSGTD